MGYIENIEKRISYGKPCMERLSEVPIKEIISAIDIIWENSCSDIYETLPHKDDIEECYKDRTITVNYKSNLLINNIEITWGYWDYITIRLSSFGLLAEYKVEDGRYKKILDLSWVLVEPFIFK